MRFASALSDAARERPAVGAFRRGQDGGWRWLVRSITLDLGDVTGCMRRSRHLGFSATHFAYVLIIFLETSRTAATSP